MSTAASSLFVRRVLTKCHSRQVNGFTRPNSAALHTNATCTMPANRYMKGTSSGIDDCDSSFWKNGNAGEH